jgi:hypothetical protein
VILLVIVILIILIKKKTHCDYALLVLGATKEDTFSIGVKSLILGVGIDVVSWMNLLLADNGGRWITISKLSVLACL